MGAKTVAAGRSRARLDAQLVARGLVESAAKAQVVILAGEVYVNNIRAGRPDRLVGPDATVEIRPRRARFVSRGGEKLEHALLAFGIDPAGTRAVDVGASTGGFTDCLLQHGARRVYAVDVGTGQLAWTLRSDPRIVVLERRDIRSLESGDLDGPVDLATVDVAFISLTRVLSAVAALLRTDGSMVALIKPQFEVEAALTRRGVVRDAAVHRDVLRRVLARANEIGLVPVAVTYSPIAGPQGNLEFFVHFRRSAPHRVVQGSGPAASVDVDAVVALAHHLVPRRAARQPTRPGRAPHQRTRSNAGRPHPRRR